MKTEAHDEFHVVQTRYTLVFPLPLQINVIGFTLLAPKGDTSLEEHNKTVKQDPAASHGFHIVS